MEQAIINVEGTTTIETAAAAKKLIGMLDPPSWRDSLAG